MDALTIPGKDPFKKDWAREMSLRTAFTYRPAHLLDPAPRTEPILLPRMRDRYLQGGSLFASEGRLINCETVPRLDRLGLRRS